MSQTDLTLIEHANAFAARHDGLEDLARACTRAEEGVCIAGGLLLAVASAGLGVAVAA